MAVPFCPAGTCPELLGGAPYQPPVPLDWHQPLAKGFLSLGCLFAALFAATNALDTSPARRSREVGLALLASVALGLGALFLLLACGVYI